MSRTGGFGLAVLLREELIRELFTDTESLFSPSTLKRSREMTRVRSRRVDHPL